MKCIPVLLLILIASISVKAAAIFSSCHGEWTDAATWQDVVIPAPGDSIYINHLISVDTNLFLIENYVAIQKNGELCGFVDVDVDIDSWIDVTGELRTDRIYIRGTVILYGNMWSNIIFISGLLAQSGGNGFVGFPGCSVPTDTCGVIASIQSELLHSGKLYPNPTAGAFKIDFPGNDTDIRLNIINSNGQLIETRFMNGNTTEIDISEHKNGIYFIQLLKDTESRTMKLLKLNDY